MHTHTYVKKKQKDMSELDLKKIDKHLWLRQNVKKETGWNQRCVEPRRMKQTMASRIWSCRIKETTSVP